MEMKFTCLTIFLIFSYGNYFFIFGFDKNYLTINNMRLTFQSKVKIVDYLKRKK